nr:uncharacterized protein LOC129383488 [Dermacentor andersoni]
MRTVVLFVANAFIGAHQVDPRVSGSYNIYFANEKCFVAGTHLPGNTSTSEINAVRSPTGNAACLLWRYASTKEQERISCRAAFRQFCSRYQGHKVYYTKEICGR